MCIHFFLRRGTRERPTSLDETTRIATNIFLAELHGARTAAGFSNELPASLG